MSIVSIKSSNTNYLKVSGLKIKGTSTGKYTLTVTSKAGVARNITVTIVDAPTRIALSAGRMNLEEGVSGKLTAFIMLLPVSILGTIVERRARYAQFGD